MQTKNRAKVLPRGLVYVTLLIVWLATLGAVGAQDNAINRIINTWRKRQERVHSGAFEFREKILSAAHTQPGKSTDMLTARLLDPSSDSKGSLSGPAGDELRSLTKRFAFDGIKMRYSVDGPQWEPAKEKFLERTYISVFDGSNVKMFYGAAEDVYPSAFVTKKGTKHPDADNRYLSAIVLYWLPFHPLYSTAKPDNWMLAGEGIAGGKTCLVVSESDPPWINKYWIDMDRECLLLRRSIQTTSGKDVMRIDIDYEADKSFAWSPKTWRLSSLSAETGRIEESYEGEMQSYRINTRIDAMEFDCEFPPNTLVTNSDKQRMYILRSGGEERNVTAEEMARHPSYADLVNSASGEAKRNTSVWQWWLFGGLVLVAAAYLVLLRRRRVS